MNGLKLEIRNWREMKRVYELDVYKLAEELSDKNHGTLCLNELTGTFEPL